MSTLAHPRVLHIVPAMFGPGGTVGGAERYVLELARYMAEATPTTLLTFDRQGREEQIGKLRVQVAGSPHYVRGQQHNPIAFGPLLRAVMAADIVHCHQLHILASSTAAAICRLTGRQVFVSDLGGGGWDVSAYISTDGWYHGHLHISEYSRSIFGHAGKPWAHVIYGGVDTEKFSPDPTVKKDGSVLFVGRLLPHKGVDDLVRAIPEDTPLEIIGRPYSDRFAQDLRDLAKGKQVTFRHGCDDAELVDAYRRAACIVLPSVYRTMYGDETKVPELLGQTLLEGMACGTPGICTRVASMPEVVEDGVTGWIVPPNSPEKLREAIQRIQSHPGEAQRMGGNARSRVLERFNWPAVVRLCMEIYQNPKTKRSVQLAMASMKSSEEQIG